jgi:hypothetical protein
MSLFSSGPIRNFETLEKGSWSSVEINISNSFQQSMRMEELGVNVELDIWLLPELLVIEVFNSYTYIILN